MNGSECALKLEEQAAKTPPQLVDLLDYTYPDERDAEANVLAQIVVSDNLLLLDITSSPSEVDEYNILVALASPTAIAPPDTYEAVVIVKVSAFGRFQEYIAENLIDDGALGPVVAINGFVDDFHPESDLVKEVLMRHRALDLDPVRSKIPGEYSFAAMEIRENLSHAAIFISPFLDGRDEAFRNEISLADRSNFWFKLGLVIVGIGAFLYKIKERVVERQRRHEREREKRIMKHLTTRPENLPPFDHF